MARQSLYPDRRLQMLQAIADLSGHGRSPAVREIATHLNLAVGTTHSYLVQARAEGLITWPDGGKRKLLLSIQGSALLAAHHRAEALASQASA